MKVYNIVVLMGIGLLCLAGCGTQAAPPALTQQASSATSETGVAAVRDMDTILSSIAESELLIESVDGSKCSVNAALALEWIQGYKAGQSKTLAIYYDGGGFPSSLYLLESDGTKQYTISCYSSETPTEPVTYQSSVIIERELDYIFGVDSGCASFPLVHKQPIMEQRVSAEAVPSSDALQIAQMVFDALPATKFFCNSTYLPATNTDTSPLGFLYKITGQVDISGYACTLVSAYSSQEEINEGAESGNVLAVSEDNTLCFIKDVASGGWIFVWDKNEQKIS